MPLLVEFFTKVGAQLVESAATAFTPYQRNGFTHGSSSADVDCDGDVDIVEIQANDNVPSNLFLNNGSGKFTLAPMSAFPLASGVQRFQEGELVDVDPASARLALRASARAEPGEKRLISIEWLAGHSDVRDRQALHDHVLDPALDQPEERVVHRPVSRLGTAAVVLRRNDRTAVHPGYEQ